MTVLAKQVTATVAVLAVGALLGTVSKVYAQALTAGVGQPPNFVLVLTDDLSNDAMDAAVDSGIMPHLKQRLIDEGITFANSFVTNALCCPSRASLLTGRYSHNHGVLWNLSPFLKPGITWAGWFPEEGTPGGNESTIATWLQAAGYHTGHLGKYLNGYGLFAPDGVADPSTYVPPGWSDWQGLIDPSAYKMYDYLLNDNGTVVGYGAAEEDYQTDVLAGRAVNYINARGTGGEPFFLQIAPLAPHVEVPEPSGHTEESDVRDMFAATIRPAFRHAYLVDRDRGNGEVPVLPIKQSFNEADLSDKPSCPYDEPEPSEDPIIYSDPSCPADRPLMEESHMADVNQQFQSMVASLAAVDDLIGAVFEALELNGLLDNTVVIFTSDNGWMYGEHRLSGKEVAYEESIRVPLLIRAPGSPAGAVSPAVVLNHDISVTIADLAGATPASEVDGASLRPLLSIPDEPSWFRTSFLVEHWFVASSLKGTFATFSALRMIKPPLDISYTTWRTNPADKNQVTHREVYNLASDPDQISSAALPAEMTGTIDELVSRLRFCAGRECLNLESN